MFSATPAKTRISPEEESGLKPINILDFAKSSPYFYKIMEPIQQEQSARVIQRAWRARKNFIPQNDRPQRYTETLTGPLSLRFIKMPTDLKHEEHARNIQAGNWLSLDFADPQALRNFYLACAKRYITPNQLVTAIMLHGAVELFQTFPRQHSFTETRPYDFRKIDYIEPKNIHDFNNALKQLPEFERQYFSVNLSHIQTIIFLLHGMNIKLQDDAKEKFKKILMSYINSRDNVSAEEKKILIESLERVSCLCAYCQSHNDIAIEEYILRNEPWAEDILESNEADVRNIAFIWAGMNLNEAVPDIEISPDFNPGNPYSPLLCMIFLTMSAFNCLQQALHGEHTTLPMYVAGRFQPLLVRQADEGLDGLMQRRPIELPHPDLVPDNVPHGVMVNTFSAMYHDLYHVTRNGVNTKKNLSREIRKFLEREKGFLMTRGLWQATDMDYKESKLLKSCHGILARAKYLKLHFTTVINRADGTDNLNTRHTHYLPLTMDHLLLIAGLILNSNNWGQLSGVNIYEWVREKNAFYKLAFDRMQKIILDDIANMEKQSCASYYVLRYVLEAHNFKDLSDALIQTDVIAWHRNGGLFIKGCYTADGNNFNFVNQDLTCSKEQVAALLSALNNFYHKNSMEITITDRHNKTRFNKLIHRVSNELGDNTGIVDRTDNTYILSRIWLIRTFRAQPQTYFQLQKTLDPKDGNTLDWRVPVRR